MDSELIFVTFPTNIGNEKDVPGFTTVFPIVTDSLETALESAGNTITSKATLINKDLTRLHFSVPLGNMPYPHKAFSEGRSYTSF
jgi:hypothetical protein